MQTPPFDAAALQAACKKALTSAAFNKFLTQAVQTVMDDTQVQHDGTVLPALTGKRHVRVIDTHDGIQVTSADESIEFTYYRTRTNDPTPGYRKPHIWWGGETRTDASGRRWTSQLPHMVQDDFGSLVPVPV